MQVGGVWVRGGRVCEWMPAARSEGQSFRCIGECVRFSHALALMCWIAGHVFCVNRVSARGEKFSCRTQLTSIWCLVLVPPWRNGALVLPLPSRVPTPAVPAVLIREKEVAFQGCNEGPGCATIRKESQVEYRRMTRTGQSTGVRAELCVALES